MSLTRDKNATRIDKNFIGIYIISLAKGMENIFKVIGMTKLKIYLKLKIEMKERKNLND